MVSRFRSASAAEAARAPARPAGYPFYGPGVLARTIPFAAIAVLAEASLALPPGPRSPWATGASVGLLLATAGFFLPRRRLPEWVRFSGPIDESLPPELRGRFPGALREAVRLLQPGYAIGYVDVAAGRDSFAAVIEAIPSQDSEQRGETFDAAQLRYAAAQAGIALEVATQATATRFAWVIPRDSAVGESRGTEPGDPDGLPGESPLSRTSA